MVAAHAANERGRGTAQIKLRTDLFDELTSRLGATSDVERARLVGVDRATIYRLRLRRFNPSIEVAQRMAQTLGTTIDELFERAGS